MDAIYLFLPRNFLFANAQSDQIKLIDFGFSTFSGDAAQAAIAGTLYYTAPEVLEPQYATRFSTTHNNET